MKKERMVTRTIKNNSVWVKVYDVERDEITDTWLDITGNVTGDDLLKACENRIKCTLTNQYKVLKILDVIITEKLYGMPESVFMLYAQELEPRVKGESEDESEG